ncbi:MAG TPA: PQQ-binding-like beta-propeller repeat protein [Thermodesulfobacteriota bacterium]
MRRGPTAAAAALVALVAAVDAGAATPFAVMPSARGHAVVAVSEGGQVVWRAPLEGRPLGVTLVGGRAVAALPDGLAAFDAATGLPAWRLPLDGRPTPPVAFGALVAVGTSVSALVAVDPATGAVAWTVDAGGPITGRPTAAGETLVAATRQRDVLAVTADGRVRWRAAVSGRVTARTATAGGVVYIAALDGRLTGLDLETGQTRLLVDLPRPVDGGLVAERDAGGGDRVVARLEDGTLAGYRLPPAPGLEARPAWTFEAAPDVPEPTAGGGRLYIGGRDLVALDLATGRVAWRLTETLGKSFARELVRRLVERERGLSPEEIRAARAASPYELRGAVTRSPVATGALVLAATDEGFLYAVDAATGELRWRVAEGD